MSRAFAFLFFFGLVQGIVGQAQLAPCRLDWHPYMKGESFPENAVQVDNDLFIIKRTRSILWFGITEFGTAKNSTKMGYFYNGPSTVESFSILVNNKECAISFLELEAGLNEAYTICAERKCLCRRRQGKDMFIGTLDYNPDDIDFFNGLNPNDGVYITKGLTCDVLRSTESLNLKITDVTIPQNQAEEIPDFLGKDIIENMSDAELDYTISHEKTTIVRYELHQSQGSSRSTRVQVGFAFSLGPLSVDIDYQASSDYEHGVNQSIVSENEETVKSSRNIIVPPWTAIHACSILFGGSERDLEYQGVGIFSIPGRGYEYVKSIILQDGYTEGDVINHNQTHVMVKMEGTFSVETPLRTKLVLRSPDDPEGCNEIMRNVHIIRRFKEFNRGKAGDVTKAKQTLKRMLGKL